MTTYRLVPVEPSEEMRQIRVYKYRIKDRRARKTLREYAYACNQVWNWCVAQHEDTLARYRAGAPKRKWLTHFDLTKECKGLGKMLGIHQQTVGSICEQFVRSRNKDIHIRFRSSFGAKRATGWVPFQTKAIRRDGNRFIYRNKAFRFFGEKRRPLPADTRGGAFVEDSLGRWWVCFCVAVEKSIAQAAEGVGIDLGLKEFATLSTGEKVAAPKHFRRLEAKIAVAQRAKNSKQNAAINIKIVNSRRDFHHKLSTRLAREYAFIAVGNVNAQRLAKTRMAKSVFDAGWSNFREMLKYKAAAFLEVDERFTTQTCSECGILGGPKGIAGLGMRDWQCSECGSCHDRDVNSARNILNLARSAPRLAEESRGNCLQFQPRIDTMEAAKPLHLAIRNAEQGGGG